MFLNYDVAFFRVSGHHDVLCGVLFVWENGKLDSLSLFYGRTRVADACGEAEDEGRVELFGEVERLHDEFAALGGVCGLYHRQLSGNGVMAAVLLVLGRVHTGVVSNTDNEACAHACVSGDEHRVSRDVKTDVLHAAESSASADRRTESCFKSDLFVRRPLAVHILIQGGIFGNLRTGSSGITGNKAHAGLVDTASGGFISQHKFFHGVYSL